MGTKGSSSSGLMPLPYSDLYYEQSMKRLKMIEQDHHEKEYLEILRAKELYEKLIADEKK